MVRAKSTTRGGKKLQEFIRRAKTADGVKSVEIGFYSTARYPDGTPVTNVALWNEFGFESKYFPVQTSDGTWIFLRRATPKQIPERPFFRQSIAKFPGPVLAILKAGVDPRTMVIDRQTAEEVGLKCANIVKRQTVFAKGTGKQPDNHRNEGQQQSPPGHWLSRKQCDVSHPRLALRVDFHESAARYGDSERCVVANAG